MTGRRLGRYRVGPAVHTGPMSTLYRAQDVTLGRPVALKVISRPLAGEEEFRTRFAEEARTLSAVDHPHVVPLYDHGDINGHLFLVMRWVDGSTVRDLAAPHPMSLAETLAVFGQVAEALDAVHARGLVHLDVKPANILVSRAEGGSPGHVYLADFGLTRRGRSVGVTQAGQFVGSPAFAAPEHLRGDPVTAATDVYGLACAIYLAVTGRAPYDGSVDEVIQGHLDGRCGPPSVVRRDTRCTPEQGLALGPATDTELERAMAQDPARRPPGATALLLGLHQAMAADARRQTSLPPARAGAKGSVHLSACARRTAPPTAPTALDPFGTRSRRGLGPWAVLTPAQCSAASIGLLLSLSAVLVVIVHLLS